MISPFVVWEPGIDSRDIKSLVDIGVITIKKEEHLAVLQRFATERGWSATSFMNLATYALAKDSNIQSL